jgi:hypothetical protein
MYYLDLHFYHFYVAQNIKYLKLILCTFVGHVSNYMWIFLEFYKTQKYDFSF